MSTVYMNLDLPVVSSTLGPEWATLLNAALEAIDNHDHTTGLGRLITSAALNINDDVSINSHNLMSARSYNMANLSATIAGATDVRCIYAVNGELYYNDSAGNQVQLTSAGAINAASVGAITGMGATTAGVAYNSTSKTFTFTQNTNQSAKIDVGDVLIRETVAAANAVTLKSPTSLAASYAVTLPTALPAANKMLQMSTTGVLSPEYVATAHIDPAGLGAAAYAALSVGTAAIAANSITAAKIHPSSGLVKLTKQVFSGAAGTYPLLIPTGVDRVFVRACGGGGGGGGGDFASAEGGNGGAGAQVRTNLVTVTASASQTFAPGDVNIGTEFITLNAHGYVASQAVIFTSSGTIPAGITASTIYYIKAPTTNTFQISSTPGGAAINITSQGTGTHTVSTAYAVVIGAGGTGSVSNNVDGTDGGETYLSSGPTKISRFPGAMRGWAAPTAVVSGDFTWENQSTPGGDSSVAGSNCVNADGIGGTAAGSGGGGGGSIGNGGNGGVTGTATAGTAGTLGGGGGGGGGGTGTSAGNGGHGYLEVLYWENINP